jgi:hypothetical protein
MVFINAQNHNQTSSAKLTSAIIFESFNINKIFFTILISLYLALSLSNYIWPSIYNNIICSALGLIALMLLSTRLRREDVIVYLFTGCLAASFLVSSLFVGRTGTKLFSPVVFIVYNFGLALILLRGYVYSWGAYIVFYGLTGYFLLMMLTGSDPAIILTTASNAISTMMIIACLFLYITLHIENKKIVLIPALLTFFFSIWGLGRTGIAASMVLLLGLLFVKLRAKRKYLCIAIIIILISYIFTYWLFDDLYKLAMNYPILGNAIEHNVQRWTRNASDPRLSYWEYYFSNLDISRLIFGVNVVEDPWPAGEINEYNYHNSFIHLHLQTGLMGLITMVLIICSLFKFYRSNQVFFILLLTLVFRSIFDSVIFFLRFDLFPFFFIFYFLKNTSFRVPHIMSLSAGTRDNSSPWCNKTTNNNSPQQPRRGQLPALN